MKTHALKTWPEFFEAIKSGAKTFEWRRDDRGFAVGDNLALLEYDPKEDLITGRLLAREITYVLRGPDFDVPEGYAVLAIAHLKGPQP